MQPVQDAWRCGRARDVRGGVEVGLISGRVACTREQPVVIEVGVDRGHVRDGRALIKCVLQVRAGPAFVDESRRVERPDLRVQSVRDLVGTVVEEVISGRQRRGRVELAAELDELSDLRLNLQRIFDKPTQGHFRARRSGDSGHR